MIINILSMSFSRRNFIRYGSFATASMFVPGFLKAFQGEQAGLSNGKVLVVVQLSGGNDGLNTVVPYRNDIYYRSRPKIAISCNEVLKATDDLGFHPALKGIHRLFADGKVCVVNGVGYPNPDRSHFRSMDIWQTGSDAGHRLDTGWVGRVLDSLERGDAQRNDFALELDDSLSLALKGESVNGLAVRDADRFYRAAGGNYFKQLAAHADEHNDDLPNYLYKTLRDATTSAEYLYSRSKLYTPANAYPDTDLGKKFKTISSLINAQSETRVYYVSHGGFDTHANQADRQQKQLAILDDAVTAFFDDLKSNGRDKDVMLMGFSEFGRRVEENAGGGTDHGTANSVFLISGGLAKPGFNNQVPRLDDLDEGDLRYAVDFKQVYATLLDNWLPCNSQDVLGKKYAKLDFI